MNNYEEKRQRLELAKSFCVCTLLVIAIAGQVLGCQKSDKIIQKVIGLEMVMQEVSDQGVCCPVDLGDAK